jgi:hypothetical protein
MSLHRPLRLDEGTSEKNSLEIKRKEQKNEKKQRDESEIKITGEIW